MTIPVADIMANLSEATATSAGLMSAEDKAALDALKNNSAVDVEDSLTSNSSDKALSANQGKLLKEMIDAIPEDKMQEYLKNIPMGRLGKVEEIAETVTNCPEVESVYLMSGAYDFCVTVKGHTFKDVAMFVAKRLAPMDGVISTATHFVLRKYKDKGVIYGPGNFDERGNCN